MFDSHAHLTEENFRADRKEVIERAVSAGVTNILVINGSADKQDDFRELLDNYEFIYGACGIHPLDKPSGIIPDLAAHKKIVAVGEIGLDYYYSDSLPKDSQISLFREQIELAGRKGLPVIIHCREAWSDMMKILSEEKVRHGVMHCFSGDEEMMEKCLDAGLYISLSGTVTFPNAEKTRRIAELVPLEKLLVETDCPYLSPQAVRGERNEPAYLKYTIEKIAEIRNMAVNELIKITAANAKNLFGIT